MNPKHHQLLAELFVKFEVLTYKQVSHLLGNELKKSAVYYCLKELVRKNWISKEYSSDVGESYYLLKPNAFLKMLGKDLKMSAIRKIDFQHRLACNDVALSLAARADVAGVALEHELIRIGIASPVIDRQPDGLAHLRRQKSDSNLTVAVEVECNPKDLARVRAVISCYEETFTLHPDRLSGVLIVAGNPWIQRVYLDALNEKPSIHRKRFIVTIGSDLLGVQESVLGRSLSHPLFNPYRPMETILLSSTPKPVYFDLASYWRNRDTYAHSESKQTKTENL